MEDCILSLNVKVYCRCKIFYNVFGEHFNVNIYGIAGCFKEMLHSI